MNIINADCIEAMRGMEASSVDSIVTDPPYGIAFMGSQWDNFGAKSCGNDSAEVRAKKSCAYAETHKGAPRYANGHGGAPTADSGRNFQAAMTPIFAEALRVAKPGAHLLAFGGSRTYHRLACAIEDAGWEVRDCIMWVYGSGFPKSMDVAKAIDKAKGYEGEVIGTRIVDVGMQSGNMHAGRKQQQQQQEVRALSPEAAAWQGWGTCLKPAYEPIIVARKPLDGTVADNVLKHGTGALNINACRIGVEERTYKGMSIRKPEGAGCFRDDAWTPKDISKTVKGRFPANFCHDGSQMLLDLFPDSKGSGKARMLHRCAKPDLVGWGMNKNSADETPLRNAGSGSAARFFYCAKASRSERGEGNDHPTVKPLALMRWLVRLVTRKGGIVLDPFCGSGTTGLAALSEGMDFIGIEKDPHYAEIAKRRIGI